MYWQRGAWAVIVKAGSSELALRLYGPEQTSAAAERMASAVLAEHARVIGAPSYVFSDIDAAIRRQVSLGIPSHGKRFAGLLGGCSGGRAGREKLEL